MLVVPEANGYVMSSAILSYISISYLGENGYYNGIKCKFWQRKCIQKGLETVQKNTYSHLKFPLKSKGGLPS